MDAIQGASIGGFISIEGADIENSGAKATACRRLASLAAASNKGKVTCADSASLQFVMKYPDSFRKLTMHCLAGRHYYYFF